MRQVTAGSSRNLARRLWNILPWVTPAVGGTRALRRRLELSANPHLIYAVGDVHGSLEPLQRLERLLIEDAADEKGVKLIVMLGDYVDRGPSSAEVIEHLKSPAPEGFYRVCLSGNHEELLLNVLQGRMTLNDWLDFGGDATLQSYGLDIQHLRQQIGLSDEQIVAEFRRSVPESHQTFLSQLPVALTTPNYFFVHAGARPGIDLDAQAEHDLMWIRRPFLDVDCPPFSRRVVHGHSPSLQPVFLPHRIGLDTGICQGGPLSAVRLAGDTATIIAVR